MGRESWYDDVGEEIQRVIVLFQNRRQELSRQLLDEEQCFGALHEIFRIFHNLKALAEFCYYDLLADACNRWEDLLYLMREYRIAFDASMLQWLEEVGEYLEKWSPEFEMRGENWEDKRPFTVPPRPAFDVDKVLKRIDLLFVEDDERLRTHMARFLRRKVGTVYEASDGEEGLAIFRSKNPALVLTDIQMPRMNGLEMVEAIRKDHPDTPVIFLTAFQEMPFRLKAERLHANGYFVKPVNFDGFSDELKKVVSFYLLKLG